MTFILKYKFLITSTSFLLKLFIETSIARYETTPNPTEIKSSITLLGANNKITPDIIEDATTHLLMKI